MSKCTVSGKEEKVKSLHVLGWGEGAGKAKCLAEPTRHGHRKEASWVYTGVIQEHLMEDRAFEQGLEDRHQLSHVPVAGRVFLSAWTAQQRYNQGAQGTSREGQARELCSRGTWT